MILKNNFPRESDERYTPLEIIRALGEFDLDPACGVHCQNRTAKTRFTSRGLERKWHGRVWLNPPFSNISIWTKKFQEHNNGIILLTYTAHTKWMHDLMAKAGVIFFLRSKPKFTNPEGRASTIRYPAFLVPLGRKNILAIADSGIPGILFTAAPSRFTAATPPMAQGGLTL